MSLLKYITKESDPIRQTYYTTKRTLLVDFINIFIVILNPVPYLQQNLYFCWFYQVMPEFRAKKNVFVLCDSWYAKKNFVRVVDEYSNLDVICNARCDSVIYDLAPEPTGRRGRPAKHGCRLSYEIDFNQGKERASILF